MGWPRQFPWVTPQSCEGCADCVGACPTGCLAMWNTVHDGVMAPWIEEVGRCTGCGRCEAACTWAAIAMTAHVEEAVERFRAARPVTRPG
jgi:formate hydrogenlyase subunit 6/NADH:ubiquinone oxidoreductase subunit I